MRVLLDECVPRRLRGHLPGHDVRTVPEMGWSGKKNGELLALMGGQGFQALLTVDQNLRHQQNVQAAGIAVVVLVAASNRLADLVPLVPSTLAALASVKPGDVVEITA
jgi:hypothetical protein